MRKYIIGAVAGAALTLSVTAVADTVSMVGKFVQAESEVVLNGKVLDTAIIIDGKSYAPARSISEAAGFKVGFEDKKVVLKMDVNLIFIENQISHLKLRLTNVNFDINEYQKEIEMFPDQLNEVEKNQKKIEELKIKKAEIEQELAELERQKGELEKG